MRDINSISICRDNFSNRQEWEDAIKRMVLALLENRQIMTIRCDEPAFGIVDIEFNPDEQEWGCKYPYWLSPKEEESVIYDEQREEEA